MQEIGKDGLYIRGKQDRRGGEGASAQHLQTQAAGVCRPCFTLLASERSAPDQWLPLRFYSPPGEVGLDPCRAATETPGLCMWS